MPQYFDSTAQFPMKSKRRVYAGGGRVGLQKGGGGGRAPVTSEGGFPMPQGHAASVQRRGARTQSGVGEPMPWGKGQWYQKGGRVGAKDGKWIQKATASIKKRGTEGKCTPITKPGCTGRAKALAKTFKKMARERKSA